MIWRTLLLTTATLALSAPAFAEAPGDAVPGHPGVTYAMLLKQIAPDLTKDENNVWTLSGMKAFRNIGAPKEAFAEAISFGSLTVVHMREDGHKRILLFSGDYGGGDGFDALLAAFDDEAKTPKLLDYMNVGGDRFNDLREVKPIAAATDMFVVTSSHSNSNQSYELDTPMFLRGGKLQSITTLFVFGNSFCRYSEGQSASYAASPQPKLPYYTLKISVSVDIVLSGETECGDAMKPPKGRSRVVSDIYRWNGKTFVPTTKAVEALSAANWKANNE